MYCDGACDWYEAAVLIPFSVFLAGLLIAAVVQVFAVRTNSAASDPPPIRSATSNAARVRARISVASSESSLAARASAKRVVSSAICRHTSSARRIRARTFCGSVGAPWTLARTTIGVVSPRGNSVWSAT